MLLDTVIDATETPSVTVVPPVTDTTTALANFGRNLPFRGQLQDVRGLSNGELTAKAGLAWKTHAMPVLVQGRFENRLAEGYQALVRGDTGDVLSIVSKTFQAHQNTDILAGISEIAAIGDAEICFAGPIDGGRKVVALAHLPGEFSLPDKRDATYRNEHGGKDFDDKTYLFAVISGGHEPGTPFKVRGMAFRRWCGNGAFFTVSTASKMTVTHRSELAARQGEIQATFASIRGEFNDYTRTAERLQATETDRDAHRLYVAELLKPGFVRLLADRLVSNRAVNGFDNVTGTPNQTMYEVTGDRPSVTPVLDALLEEVAPGAAGFARTFPSLLDAIVNQTGSNGSNLWSAYNGVTWHVDHVRGRSPETAADSALFGVGAGLKERALEVARMFAK